MSSGRINSPESIKLAGEVFRAFGGSWDAVEKAAVRDGDGVLRLSRRAINEARARTATRS